MKEEKEIETNIKPLTKKEIIVLSCVIVVGVIFLVMLIKVDKNTESNYDNFANCLTEKGVKMYGISMCAYCIQQKELFGDSFQYVDYVDCDRNEECSHIMGYPAWEINGSLYYARKDLEKLSELSGCNLTQ